LQVLGDNTLRHRAITAAGGAASAARAISQSVSPSSVLYDTLATAPA